MRREKLFIKNFGAGVLIIIYILSVLVIHTASAEGSSEDEIVLSFSFTEPEITEVNISNTTYHKVTMNGIHTIGDTGLPMLPVKPLNVLLPQKGVLKSINVTCKGSTLLGDGYNVLLGAESSNLSEQQNESNESNFDPTIPYPTELFNNVGTYDFRGYSIFVFNLYPVYYTKETGEIYYYENMTVTIKTTDTGSTSPWLRGLTGDELIMKQKVDDYSMLNTYTSIPDSPGNSSIVDPSKKYDYVIITKKDFANAPIFPPDKRWWYTFQDLADYKNNSTGIKTTIVSVEDILNQPEYHWDGIFGDGQNESIFNDTQCHIRNFIKDAYINWGIEYVLLGGDNSSSTKKEIVPARNLFCISWVYIGELPSDLYYACLDGTYNNDTRTIDLLGVNRWGESTDGAPGGDGVEPNVLKGSFYAEADSTYEYYGVGFDVGLFTPSLNLSDCDLVRLRFCSMIDIDEFVWANVSTYSGGTNASTSEFEQTLWSNNGSGDQYIELNNLSNYTDNKTVYIVFHFKNESGTTPCSFNIDNVSVWKDLEEEPILNESFEDWPPNNWTQVYFNSSREGSWMQEYYRVDVDLMAEVYVGRAPVGNSREVSNFVKKTLSYEKTFAHDPYLKRVLMVGQNISTGNWGGTGKDALIDFNETHKTYGIPSDKYNISKLYDRDWDSENWPIKELRKRINNRSDQINIINNDGHGYTNWAMKMFNPHTLLLTNNKYFFVYSQACLAGAFDNYYPKIVIIPGKVNISLGIRPALDCFAECLTVKTKHGAFAVIMNARLGEAIGVHGASQTFDRMFLNTTYGRNITHGENITELGKANQDSKEEILNDIHISANRLCYYQLNLLGDPTVSLKLPGENNTAPNKPKTPKISFHIGGLYTFYTNTTEPEGDNVSYKWKWDDNECLFWTKYHPSDQNASKIMILPSGYHNISVKARDVFLAESEWSDPLPVTVSFNSNIQVDSTTAVLDEELQLFGQASGGTEPYNSWYYDFDDGNNSQQQNTTHTYNALGNYTVTLNVTDNQNITSNVSKVINVVLLNADFESSPGLALSNLQETFNFNDKSKGYYDIVNWTWDFGDGNTSYDRNTSHSYSSYSEYNVTLTVTDNQSNNHTFYQMIYTDSVSPTITSVTSNFDVVGYGSNVTITVNTSDNSCGIKNVKINITYPDNSYVNHTMNNSTGSIYEYVFTDCWQLGEYSYTVWIADTADNGNCSSENDFVVSRTFGLNKIGSMNQTIWDTITGSVFMVNEKGVADNISVYLDPGNASSDYHYACTIYHHNESVLVGISEEKNITSGKGWQTFNFSVPKPVLLNDTDYVIGCWSDNSSVSMYYEDGVGFEEYYDDGNSTLQGHYFEGVYNYTPDMMCFDHEDRKYSIYCCYTPDNTPPEITNVSDSPDTVGFGFNVTITADVTDNQSGVETVKVNITYPNSTVESFKMDNIGNDTYEFVFNDTWLKGQYSYLIWAVDYANNSNSSSGYSFTVSAQATINVCTIKDSYGNNETVNLTDPPPASNLIGYELLDDDQVLRIWNRFDSYYFDTSSGIQLTNHYDEYWSHNVLMLGYYNNDEWNLIYRTDELSGFHKEIDSDNETYVNATLWKDLTYKGYDFRLAIRYHLGVDDNELTVIPYIKNLDDEDIPYVLGFGWEMKDIQIDMTPGGDYIDVNQTMYYLNQTLDNVYTDLTKPEFYLMENITSMSTKSLYLKWKESLTYKLQVKSRTGQYNAPVTLFVRIGTLDSGQEKQTKMFWYDADQATFYFNNYSTGEAWPTNPSYMVDGNPSNSASTTVDGDIELCNGNNCSGSDIGTVSKVEFRVCAFYSDNPRDTILRPVFGGTTDGVDYPYQTPPGTESVWSPWFDITDDPFAPQSWSWTDVENLDCDVEAKNEPGAPTFTLYCSKVEIRVTYTPYAPPEISNPYPSNGSIGVSLTPMLNITVNDENGDNMDISWLSNSSGSWQVFGTNNSVGNGTYHQTFSNATENGKWWYWKVNVSDGNNFTESSVYKFYTGYESKIKNTGSTNIKGYLVIQVQYYNTSNSSWFVADDTINETNPRTINSSDQFGLDTVFNGLLNIQDLSEFGNGTYRIYTAFRDPDGNILKCDDETELVATYEFSVIFE